MAKLKSRMLRFTPSVSPDAVAHRVRIFPDGTFGADINEVITADANQHALFYDAIYTEIPLDDPGAQVVADIATMSVVPQVEGIYDVFVTAVDGLGNEGDVMDIQDTVFDFSPPAAPTDGSIV